MKQIKFAVCLSILGCMTLSDQSWAGPTADRLQKRFDNAPSFSETTLPKAVTDWECTGLREGTRSRNLGKSVRIGRHSLKVTQTATGRFHATLQRVSGQSASVSFDSMLSRQGDQSHFVLSGVYVEGGVTEGTNELRFFVSSLSIKPNKDTTKLFLHWNDQVTKPNTFSLLICKTKRDNPKYLQRNSSDHSSCNSGSDVSDSVFSDSESNKP